MKRSIACVALLSAALLLAGCHWVKKEDNKPVSSAAPVSAEAALVS